MKQWLVIVLLVCITASVHAYQPDADVAARVAERTGISKNDLQAVVSFARSLYGDELEHMAVVSFYPPRIDVSFVSGKHLIADGTTLTLIEDAERTIYAESVCPVMLIVCGLLLWAGFVLLSLPLFVAGIECAILIAIICT
ncbi:MAG: hypothetical protein N3B18_05175 [Desulfobacterota bacterium]|nr:hypothetical protein [Thermodesulfobacteriota bacterium]